VVYKRYILEIKNRMSEFRMNVYNFGFVMHEEGIFKTHQQVVL